MAATTTPNVPIVVSLLEEEEDSKKDLLIKPTPSPIQQQEESGWERWYQQRRQDSGPPPPPVVMTCCNQPIPARVKKCSQIVTLKRRKSLADNLCFFRCLALASGAGPRGIHHLCRRYFTQWKARFGHDGGLFPGVKLEDLGHAEQLFLLSINVVKMGIDGSVIVTRKSSQPYPKLMSVLMLNEGHYCYIKPPTTTGSSSGGTTTTGGSSNPSYLVFNFVKNDGTSLAKATIPCHFQFQGQGDQQRR